MIRFTRISGSCVGSSRACDARLAPGGGVGDMNEIERNDDANTGC